MRAARPEAAPSMTLRLLLVALPLCLGGCSMGVLHPKGPVATAERALLFDSLAIMLCIAVPTILAIGAFAFWFRAGNARAARRPHFTYSGAIELLVWGVPALTIMLLGGVAWIGAHRLDPATPIAGAKPLEIEAVALDWKWLFLYPEQGIATVNRLPVPAGRPLHFSMTSATVMNAFFVPELGSMLYVMNGMTSRLWLQADAPGHFRGISSHFSGDGFPSMHFDVEAMPDSAFAAWAAHAGEGAPALDAAGFKALANDRTGGAPASYRLTDPHLFDDIVSQKIGPAPYFAPLAPGKS